MPARRRETEETWSARTDSLERVGDWASERGRFWGTALDSLEAHLKSRTREPAT